MNLQEFRKEFLEDSEHMVDVFSNQMKITLLTRPVLKSEVRIKEKLREDQKGIDDYNSEREDKKDSVYDSKTDTYDCRTIRDCDGHTMCFKSISDLQKVLKSYNGRKNVARIKNNFAKPTDVGYSDVNMNIKLSNGVIVELQLNTTANMVAKESYGHSLYEVYRSIESNDKYKELADIMGSAQTKLYSLANKYSQRGTFPMLTKDEVFGYSHKPYADAIRSDVQKAIPLFNQAKADGVLNDTTIKHFEHLVDFIK